MWYEAQLNAMTKTADTIHGVLQWLWVHNEIMKDREDNKERYKQAYCEHYKGQFVSTKIYTVLQENAVDEGDREAIKAMVISNWAKKLIQSCINYLAQRKYHEYDIFSRYKSMSSRILFLCLTKNTLFHSGYAMLMKHTRPDDKERKEVRRQVIQAIIQRCLKEIEQQLLHADTFDDKVYHLIKPLKYWHGEYKWDASEIKIAQKDITDNYLHFLDDTIISKNWTEINKIKATLHQKKITKEKCTEAYNSIDDILTDINGYILISCKHS